MKIPYLEKIFRKKQKKILNKFHYSEIYTKTFNDFSIIPREYEKALNNKYGIELGKLKNGRKSKFKGNLEKNVSFNGSGKYSLFKIKDEILKKYSSTPNFCSMIINNKEELMEHVRNIHELSYNHYVFGKETNMKGKFPNFCCGKSGSNLLLTLMEKGYSNASYFYNDHRDHAYNGLPFLFGKNKKKGFIIVDPTSDQLFKNKNRAPRNNVFVVSGEKWKYETDWKHGADLFPNSDDSSTFSNLYTLRKNPNSKIYESENIKKYFENIFENPIDVNIESY